MKYIRFICSFLLASFLFSCLPLFSLAVEREDNTNLAAKDYTEDTYLFRYDFESGISISSGDPTKWNSFYGGVASIIDDPLHEGNKVGNFYVAAGKSATLSNVWLNPDGQSFVFGTDFMIPIPAEGNSYPDTVTLTLSTTAMTFTYDAENSRYAWTFLGETGYYLPGTWIRMSLYVTSDETLGLSAASADVFLSGALYDSENNARTYLNYPDKTLAYTTTRFAVSMTKGADASCAYCLDDTVFYLPGDFAPSTVSTVSYGDAAGNIDLNGDVTVKLYHDLDLSTFDIEDLVFTNSACEDVRISSVVFDPAQPDLLKLRFNEEADTLLTYTDYYITFPDTVRDICGNPMHESVVSFTTKGAEDTRPVATPLAVEPEGGYIMPDRYNTGYRCAESELVPFTEKYPAFSSTDVVITESLARKYNYEFSGFTLDGAIKVTATSPVYIHDFYLNGTTHYALTNAGSQRLTIAWAEVTGSRSSALNGANTTFSHVYCHDVTADHCKGSSGQIYESCYLRDGGTRCPGAHADVIQISGSTDTITQNIKILGCRFDIPALAYEHVANACIFMKPEWWGGEMSQGYANIQISYNWFNGGGYTAYIVTNDVSVDRLSPITYSYNKLGCGHMYGTLNTGGWTTADFDYHDNGYTTALDAGSVVFYDENGTRVFYTGGLIGDASAEVLVNLANYTSVDRTCRVAVEVLDADGAVVKSYEASDSIVRNMSSKEYYKDNTQTIVVKDGDGNDVSVTALINLPDLPSDVPCTVALSDLPDMTDCTLAVRIYDTTGETEQLIRNENLLKLTHTVTFTDRNGEVLKTETVADTQAATAPDAPTVENYSFTGWSVDFSCVTSDLTVQAQYTRLYTVTFTDKDGAILKTEQVLSGSAAVAPEPPEVEHYAFIEWSDDFSSVTSDLMVQALYGRLYTVTFKDAKGNILKIEQTPEGTAASAPETVPAHSGYLFTGWSVDFSAVTEDLTVQALYGTPLSFDAASLFLSDCIAINFYLPDDDAARAGDFSVAFCSDDNSTYTPLSSVGVFNVGGVAHRRYIISGINACQMQTEYTVAVFDENGETVSTKAYSIYQYACRMYGTDNLLDLLLVSMIEYGNAAQATKGLTPTLTDAFCTETGCYISDNRISAYYETVSALLTPVTVDETAGIETVGLTLNGNVQPVFTTDSEKNITSAKVTVCDKDYSFAVTDNRFTVTGCLSVTNLDTVMTVALYSGETKVGETEYTIANYLRYAPTATDEEGNPVLSLQEQTLAKALAVYMKLARIYVGYDELFPLPDPDAPPTIPVEPCEEGEDINLPLFFKN